MIPNSRLRALPLLLVPFLACGQEVPKPAEAPAAEGTPQKLERFEVTGSRVRRLDYETPVPVVTYTAANIDEKAYTTLGEFVQSLPYSNSTANSEFTTASFITGAATINPRGLGSNRFLTLVNGRRTVPYALTNSASGTPQSIFNFNSLPSAAIERIDFLKDGASAIYGSDAITGVFNIILKKDYVGSAVDITLSNTLGHDSLSRRINLFSGVAKDGWEISGGFSLQTRHANFLQDFDTPTTDFRFLGVKGANQNSLINNPSYLYLSAAQATAAGMGNATGYYIIPGGQPTATPTKASFTFVGSSANIPDANRYNFAPVTQIYPESESYNANLTVNRRLTSWATAFSTFLYSRGNTHYLLQPYGFTSTISGFTLPASNPYNPTGINLTNTSTNIFAFRSVAPIREVRTETLSGVAGLRGTSGRGWNWESALNYGRNETQRDTDLIRDTDFQAALNGTTRETALNPFGPSEVASRLFTRSRGLDGLASSLGWDASVNGAFWQFPWRGGGEAALATGVEFRRDTLRSNPEPRNYLGFTATTPYSGRRQAGSAFVELSLPVQRWLEFQLAGRHERFSDFGRTSKPKASGKLRLPSNRFLNVLIRGSYSESFKAPDLGQLYQPQSFAITSAAYLDPLRPQDAARQLRTLVGGNPSLKPEEGKVQYTGFVFEVPAIRGLSFSADFFDIKVRNVINTLSAGYLLSSEGRKNFPNAIVRDTTVPEPGPILYFYGISNNLGLQLYRGWDLGARYVLRQARLGSFTFSVDATNVMKRGSDAGQGAGFGDATGYYFAPEWRWNSAVSWRKGVWGAAVNADTIGKFFNDRQSTATFAGWGENPYTTLNASVNYRGFRRTTLTVGANNVLNNRPPPNGFLTLGFDDRAYGNGVLGINLFVRVRREF